MRRLDRYLGRTVLFSCLTVLLLIVGLDTLFALVDNVTSRRDNFSVLGLSQYLALTLPGRVYEFTPLAMLIGCLVGVGFMASSSELTVMRAAGVSKIRILLGVAQPVLLLVLLVCVVGEWVVPIAEQQATALKAKARGKSDSTVQRWNVWHREGEWFINATAIDVRGTLYGLTRYRVKQDQQLAEASFARTGVYREGGWLLHQVSSSRFESNRVRASHEAEQFWETELRPELLQYLTMEPSKMSIRGLFRYSQYLETQGVNAGSHRFALWSKLLMPVAVFALMLIACSFVFGSMRSVTLGQRVIVGVMVGLAFKFSQDLFGPASLVFGFAPWLAALIPVLVCLFAGALMLRRAG